MHADNEVDVFMPGQNASGQLHRLHLAEKNCGVVQNARDVADLWRSVQVQLQKLHVFVI